MVARYIRIVMSSINQEEQRLEKRLNAISPISEDHTLVLAKLKVITNIKLLRAFLNLLNLIILMIYVTLLAGLVYGIFQLF